MKHESLWMSVPRLIMACVGFGFALQARPAAPESGAIMILMAVYLAVEFRGR